MCINKHSFIHTYIYTLYSNGTMYNYIIHDIQETNYVRHEKPYDLPSIVSIIIIIYKHMNYNYTCKCILIFYLF